MDRAEGQGVALGTRHEYGKLLHFGAAAPQRSVAAAIFMRFRRQPDEAARRDAYDTAAGLTTTTKGTRHHGQDSTYHIASQ